MSYRLRLRTSKPKSRHFVEDPEVVANWEALARASEERSRAKREKAREDEARREAERKLNLIKDEIWKRERKAAHKFVPPEGYDALSKVEQKALKKEFKNARKQRDRDERVRIYNEGRIYNEERERIGAEERERVKEERERVKEEERLREELRMTNWREANPEEAALFDDLMRVQREEKERITAQALREWQLKRERRQEVARQKQAIALCKLDEQIHKEMAKWGVKPRSLPTTKVVHIYINLSGGLFSMLGAFRAGSNFPQSNSYNMPDSYARPSYTDESYYTRWPASESQLAALDKSRAKYNKKKPLSMAPPKRVKLPRQKRGYQRQRYGAPHNSKSK